MINISGFMQTKLCIMYNFVFKFLVWIIGHAFKVPFKTMVWILSVGF